MGNSVYEERPWLKCYPEGMPADIETSVVSISEEFDAATEKWKNKTAIIFYGKKIGFAELREKVDRLATALCDLGVRKGDRVAILMLNSPEWIIAFHAGVKIGAIISPISPVYVSLEIKHQLEDSGADTIICQDILYEGVEKTGVKLKNVILGSISDSLPAVKTFMGKSVLRGVYQGMTAPSSDIYQKEGFYRFKDLLKKYPPNPPKVEIDAAEDVASLIYTGGTTGLPKGVMLTHRNVLLSDYQEKYWHPILEEGKEVLPGYMPFYHRAGQIINLVACIIRGWTQVIITNPNVDDIIDNTVNYKVSYFAGAPTMYEMLKNHPKTNRVNWKGLKILGSGTDTLHISTAEEWKARTGVTIQDMYGATETGFCIGSIMGKEKAGSVGVPVPGVMAAILDPDLDEFLPVGEIGEIVISGPNVTNGYWKKPEATQECETYIDGVRWWRTGDLGRMDEDGYFYVYDRKSDLIKYKGLRIHGREVEDVLKAHPQIKTAGVIGVPDVTVGQIVKAFVVLESDARGRISEGEIIEYCQDKLAHYKIPKIVEFRGELPLTDVGKVSRRELREEEEEA